MDRVTFQSWDTGGQLHDFENFEQATWPVEPGSPVYLFQAGPHYGQPGELVECWPPDPIPAGKAGDERCFHYWRGLVRLKDGSQVEGWELEIAVLRPPSERGTLFPGAADDHDGRNRRTGR